MMGSTLSDAQAELIVEAVGPQGQVTLCFDGDESDLYLYRAPAVPARQARVYQGTRSSGCIQPDDLSKENEDSACVLNPTLPILFVKLETTAKKALDCEKPARLHFSRTYDSVPFIARPQQPVKRKLTSQPFYCVFILTMVATYHCGLFARRMQISVPAGRNIVPHW